VLCGEGAIPALLARTGGGFACAAADQARIQAHIAESFGAWEAGATACQPNDPVRQFERRRLSGQLAGELDRLCGPAP
jgi:hypothetical protein